MLVIEDYSFSSRLFLGTGKFSSNSVMIDTVKTSGAELVTVALKRVDLDNPRDEMLAALRDLSVELLPNTAGATTVDEAVFAAKMARECLGTRLIKLEIHPDTRYLMPDPVETLKAAEILVKLGFVVMPYIHADPVICRRLVEVGCAVVMPLGSPIGSNKGLLTKDFLEIIIEQSTVPVIVDAGLGCPSDAALAMEIGADAVLVNSSIAVAKNPENMAGAFSKAVVAGYEARHAGISASQKYGYATSPLTSFLA